MRTADVLKHFHGSPAEVAKALGISEAAVKQWGELVPPTRAGFLAQITGLTLDPAAYAHWNKPPGPRPRKAKAKRRMQ